MESSRRRVRRLGGSRHAGAARRGVVRAANRTGQAALALAMSSPTPPTVVQATPSEAGSLPATARLAARVNAWLGQRDWTFWLLIAIALLSLIPRLYGLNWDADNHLHPDERQIDFVTQCLTLPGMPRPGSCPAANTGPGWFFSKDSPLNPHFFAYGSFPLYLLAAFTHLLAWLTSLTGGRFVPPDGGTWDDFNHFTLVGRALSACFDAGSVLLTGLLARRLIGRDKSRPYGGAAGYVALLAAALVAVIPFNIQVSHFYAVDTPLLFFVLLTLFGCVLLAQVGSASETWRSYGAALFTGAAFALAMATKVSALPLLAPIAVALLLRWRRRGFDEFFLALLAVVAAGLLVYLAASPYTLIDLATFQQQVGEQTALSQGKLDYPYVRQFADTAPYLYPIRQMLVYDMGLPLGVLGLAGFGWAAARLWRTLDDDWAIVVVWIAGYFAVVGGSYTKFSRYMLPIFAPLALCGAAALGALAVWGYHKVQASRRVSEVGGTSPAPTTVVARIREIVTGFNERLTRLWGPQWWPVACVALGLTIFANTLVSGLALANIYSAPNTRVQASEWIYDNVRPGATISNEIWDDALPIGVPPARVVGGLPETHAGSVINQGQYLPIGLDLYAEDTPEKAATFSQQLASADVVVISSQRLLKSIPKLPDRYPMTTRYYQLLFAGTLGFHLAAHFENAPHLLGYTLDDSGADESFSVYDHPPVWIFTRTGTGLTADQIQAALTQDVRLPAISQRPGSLPSLMLGPAAQAANAATEPLGVQFPADSLPNTIPLIWWLLAVELLGLVSFPLAYVAFPGLRDRGWGLAKLLGLLALGLAVWLPASLELLPFDRWVVWLAFALLMVAGLAVGWRNREALAAFVRARWKLLVIGEAAFVAAYLGFALIRALDPDLWHIWRGGEKPMELAYLDGILRSRYMPPADPWFAGGAINYYYYGQFLIAVLIKLTGIAPTTAFNLALALLFGLTFAAAYSVVAGLTGRAWTGLLAGFGLVVLGNLDGLWQLLNQWHAVLGGLQAPPFDYWESSRVIPTTINEFPYWSFLYGDLHAHLIDLPVTVFLIGCCGSLLASARAQARRWAPALPTLAVAALALGAAWCINTWDLPTYAALFALVLALRVLPARGGWRALLGALDWPLLRNYAVASVVVLGLAYALYAPFHSHFATFVSGIGTVTTPTAPYQFAVLFGVFLFITASFFVTELADRAAAPESLLAAVPRPLLVAIAALALLVAFLLSLKLFLAFLLVMGLWVALANRAQPVKLLTCCLLLLGLGVALGVELVYVRDFLDNSPYERMNTVFKFYYQVWTCLALGSTLAFVFLARRFVPASLFAAPQDTAVERGGALSASSMLAPLREFGGGMARTTWFAVLVVLVAGSCVFLFEGTQARLNDPALWAQVQPPPGGFQPQGLSLDGMAYMRGWYPGDYDAITWMNQHIGGMPTLVEASTGVYNWHGRVSVYTGLPDVIQLGHENEQRYSGQEPYGDQVGARQADVEQFWATADPAAAADFLREYHVQLVYVGTLERTCYIKSSDCVPLTTGALGKFQMLQQQGMLRPIYSNAEVVIYSVNPQANTQAGQ
jgi:YYY domain-containing protein